MDTVRFKALPQGEKLSYAQQVLAQFHQQKERSYYLEAYKDAEATYWFPLLNALDTALLTAGKKVLDVGTAYGTLLLYSVLSGARGYGLDMTDRYWSPELETDYGIAWARCNIESDPIPWEETFDVILFTEVLEHMNYNPIPVFRKLHSRLASGGVLLLSTPWARAFTHRNAWIDILEVPYYKPGDPFVDAECKYFTIDEIFILASQTGLWLNSLQVYNGHLLVGFYKP